MKPTTHETAKRGSGSLQRLVRLLSTLQSQELKVQKLREATWQLAGQEMRELREASGLSLREASRRLKISAPFLSDMELGRRRPTIEWAEKLHDAIQPNISAQTRSAPKNAPSHHLRTYSPPATN